MADKIIIDIDCEQRGISGTLEFDSDNFDQLEIVDIAEMILRVIESWCERRNFELENIQEYDVTFN